MWFKILTGFDETSPAFVRENMFLENNMLQSKVNGERFQCGVLEIPTLESLIKQAPDLNSFSETLKVSQMVGDVQQFHCLEENKNALFQAASQFNLLEMVAPSYNPEHGVDGYENDHTQGPACAIACGAGTIYRNYFVPINKEIGQSRNNQIDCLDLIGEALKNKELLLWDMRNGYALPSQEGLLAINGILSKMDSSQYENLKNKLKIGIQWDTEVTIAANRQIVSQAYCSALPVSYTNIESYYWERFARLILDATYEATFYAGLINYAKTGSKKVFLTLVGGGAFGNDFDWIEDAISKSIQKFKKTPLEISIVSYGKPNPRLDRLIEDSKKIINNVS